MDKTKVKKCPAKGFFFGENNRVVVLLVNVTYILGE